MARKKKQDEDASQEDLNNNNDDTFGLPEIEYQPLDREDPPQTESTAYTHQTENPKAMEREELPQQEDTSSYYTDDDYNSPWPKILGIAAVLLLVAAGAWYFVMYRPQQQEAAAEKARQEQEAEAARQREADLAESRRLEAERRAADSLAALNAVPPVGTIDTLTERTGRYYVIVASAIDGDLLIDYAKKLTPKGVSPKLIPPYGNVKFYRLAVADGDTYASTQATADQLKTEYTEGAWVIRY